MASNKIISEEELGKHNSADDCWISVLGKVLKVTQFLDDHPGGRGQILKFAGKDCTEIWMSLHEESFIDEYIPQDCHMGYLSEEARDKFEGKLEDRVVEDGKRMVIIGHGPVSQNFIEALIKSEKKNLPRSAGKFAITVFCEELRPAYDRVGMTKYFEKRDPAALNITDMKFMRENGVHVRIGEQIVEIDRQGRKVLSSKGNEWFEYDKLIIATGSYCFVPPIKGLDAENTQGVFLYRTIEDMQGMIDYSEKPECKYAGVLGGGLLGLEAAKAVYDLEVPTAVLEVAPFLMPQQLDAQGGHCLGKMITDLGLDVHCGLSVHDVVSENGVLKGLNVTFAGKKTPEFVSMEMLVISCGVRPRDELARKCKLEVAPRGGIVVDSYMRTSDPNIFAIGEVASYEGRAYGLVAPGFEQARTLVNLLMNEVNPKVEKTQYLGSDLSTKLKLMGVDVASFGQTDAFWMDKMYDDSRDIVNGGEFVFLRQHDPFSGYYRKLIFSKDQKELIGGICVGDASDYQVLLNLCKKGMQAKLAKDLFMGGGALEIDPTALDDDDVVCTCQGVTKGQVCEAIEEQELETMDGLKAATKCGQGCGGCVLSTGFVPKIFTKKLEELGKEAFTGICAHFPFTRAELYEIIAVKRLDSFDQVMKEASRNAPDQTGCEICKPAVASILATLWNDLVVDNKHATIQDTNDSYLANIQRNGQYSVIPRVPGGEIVPAELELVAKVAKKWKLWTKITANRVAMYGANVQDLPEIYKEVTSGTVDGELICPGGMESGHAYGKAFRTSKGCVGSAWCRFGQQDSVNLSVRIENRYKGLRSPHKLKAGFSGCLRECGEARTKDFGAIAGPNGYTVYVGGNGGASPSHGEVLEINASEDRVVQLLDRTVMFYCRTAGPLIRMNKWLQDIGGIQHLIAVVVNDKLGICEELEKQMQRHVDSYFDEWKAVADNPELQKRFKQFVNDAPPTNGDIPYVDEATDPRQMQKKIALEDWPALVGPPALTKGDATSTWTWMYAGMVDDVPDNGGVAVRFGDVQLAVFKHVENGKTTYYCTTNSCPHKQLNVLSRGLIGVENGRPKVVCPIHKNRYHLDNGLGITNKGFNLATFDVKVEGHKMYVHIPPMDELNKKLARQVEDHSCSGGCGDSSGDVADIEDLIQPSVL